MVLEMVRKGYRPSETSRNVHFSTEEGSPGETTNVLHGTDAFQIGKEVAHHWHTLIGWCHWKERSCTLQGIDQLVTRFTLGNTWVKHTTLVKNLVKHSRFVMKKPGMTHKVILPWSAANIVGIELNKGLINSALLIKAVQFNRTVCRCEDQ